MTVSASQGGFGKSNSGSEKLENSEVMDKFRRIALGSKGNEVFATWHEDKGSAMKAKDYTFIEIWNQVRIWLSVGGIMGCGFDHWFSVCYCVDSVRNRGEFVVAMTLWVISGIRLVCVWVLWRIESLIIYAEWTLH